MALAEYFSKNLLAISQVLSGGSSGQFQNILNNTVVGIAFDEEVNKHEGKAALDMAVRLVARLYPRIKFISLGSDQRKVIENFQKLALSINSKIEFVNDDPTVLLAIGNTSVNRTTTTGPIFYIGSENWVAKFSNEEPVGVGDSNNPLAAGVATCIGSSNVFRYVFSDYLPTPEFDEAFALSLITLNDDGVNASLKSKQVDLGNFQLAGFGAIGNGFTWALANTPFVKGSITIVEPEDLELSNLQRYVLAEERHIGKSKLEIAKEILSPTKINSLLINDTWVGYLNKQSWNNETAVIAIDNANDRIGIQASLPRSAYNSYTESNVLGVSRHHDFLNGACVVCTYMPSGTSKSRSQEISDNLKLPNHEKLIREYVFRDLPADDQILGLVSQANNIEISLLEEFRGMSVNEFYSKVVCGGILMELRGDDETVERIEAPLAFQSAMAGILEFSELLIAKSGLRKTPLPNKTQFYPLAPVKSGSNPYNHTFEKDKTGRCICADPDFINAYKSKWN